MPNARFFGMLDICETFVIVMSRERKKNMIVHVFFLLSFFSHRHNSSGIGIAYNICQTGQKQHFNGLFGIPATLSASLTAWTNMVVAGGSPQWTPTTHFARQFMMCALQAQS